MNWLHCDHTLATKRLVEAGPLEEAVKSIGIREFRDNATKLLAGGEGLRIERHGHLVGYFVPAQTQGGDGALVELAALLRDAIDNSNLSQAEMVNLLRGAR